MYQEHEAALQSISELIFKLIQQLPTRADGAAALALAQCSLIWKQNPRDETHVREIIGWTTKAIVKMWKDQVDIHDKLKAATLDKSKLGN